MANSGRTVLLFLGTCLAFAEICLGVIAGLADPNANLVAAFALIALAMVLATLAFMYRINPGFLTLSGQEASGLAMLQTMFSKRQDLITPAIIRSLISGNLVHGEADKVDEAAEITRAEHEATELDSELERERRIRGNRPQE
ncbi:MAG: hypothetical protein FJ316_08440 [SAR202 cluster bacterium]|nr:hypothetical protein [SAR202 cluster bacterium]